MTSSPLKKERREPRERVKEKVEKKLHAMTREIEGLKNLERHRALSRQVKEFSALVEDEKRDLADAEIAAIRVLAQEQNENSYEQLQQQIMEQQMLKKQLQMQEAQME